jgi:hypothetical protein
MRLYRVLQWVGYLGLLGCALLLLRGTPLLGADWAPGRMLYAAAGMFPALTLLGIARIGIHLDRVRDALARIEKRLEN